jgi:ankyrin repeat protein
VKGLLERGADPEAVDKKNVSALHFACGQGRLGVVQFLWSRGVELDSEDPGHAQPTHDLPSGICSPGPRKEDPAGRSAGKSSPYQKHCHWEKGYEVITFLH